MGALLVVARQERVEAGLLLEKIRGRGLRGGREARRQFPIAEHFYRKEQYLSLLVMGDLAPPTCVACVLAPDGFVTPRSR